MPSPRITSCMSCRRRKVRCDRVEPRCGRCLDTKRECLYPERKKTASDWKRPDVNALEARLRVVESQLAQQVAKKKTLESNNSAHNHQHQSELDNSPSSLGRGCSVDAHSHHLVPENISIPTGLEYLPAEISSLRPHADGMSLQEPLPPTKVQEELFKIYFDQLHACNPLINEMRFYGMLALGLDCRPFLALQYAMWSAAASVTPRYEKHCEVFIQRARKYAAYMELERLGEPHITIYDAQSWCLIANVEAQRVHISQAWTSAAKCVRLVQMLGLHCIDRPGVYGARFLPPTNDSSELEERRRTFWAAYMCDCWISALGGWPMTIQESGIWTHLPISEDSFSSESQVARISLAEALAEGGASNISSSFAGVILATALLAREYVHIQRSVRSEHTEDGNDGFFWNTHRELDNTITNTLMFLPERFKNPHELRDPNVIFLVQALHVAAICLHRTVINKRMVGQGYSSVVSQSMARCTTAAHAITSTIRMASHQNMSRMSPWTGYCLHVAATKAYVQYLKSRQRLTAATLET
ncbi:hypothetical protein DL95DRAFT_348870 [Leptodontidium sp. 2 PMI_412]|nr:hypothetical protein DL95DRAFT_348870 [Leptodontidium sp. 2 PMI_412]